MIATFSRAALAAGIAAALAACGGRLDDVPAQPQSQAAAPAASAMPVHAPPHIELQRPPIASDASVADLRQEVVLLRREVADLREQVMRLPGSSSAEADKPNPRTDPVAKQEAQQAEALRVASSETAFQSEHNDPRWSQATATALQTTIGQVDASLRNQVRSIECRSQSCRVEINAGAGSALAQELPLIVTRLGDTLPHVTAGQVDQGDGQQATVLYLSR